jgi:hypothetical protein
VCGRLIKGAASSAEKSAPGIINLRTGFDFDRQPPCMLSRILLASVLSALLVGVHPGYAESKTATTRQNLPANSTSKDTKLKDGSIRCHKFLGWHWSYHTAVVFVTRDKVILENGICRFLLSADKPKEVLIYDEEEKVYFPTTIKKWYDGNCDSIRPFDKAKLVASGNEKLLDLPCRKFDAIDKQGAKCGVLWTTNAVDIDPRLISSVADFLGLPNGYGLPIRANTMEHGKTTRYVPLNAKRQKNATYEKAGPNTLFEVTQKTLVQPYAYLNSHTIAQRPQKDFVVPPGTAKAASVGALIYGEGGKLTESSIDQYMTSTTKKSAGPKR